LSFILHLLLFLFIAFYVPAQDTKKVNNYTSIVTFKAIPKPKPLALQAVPPPEAEKILETPLEKTEPPVQADYLGAQNHQAKIQQKLAKNKQVITRNQDPGKENGNGTSKHAAQATPKSISPPSFSKEDHAKAMKKYLAGRTKNAVKPRNRYEKLLDTSNSMMEEDTAKGYQDYLDGKLAEGDFIDLNTQEYRYIGYFTSLRKAIELAWSYPSSAAANGIYGKVGIAFTILKNGSVGKVAVINSSGYAVLDTAIVDAIQHAAPFAPLPDGFAKKNLNISGIFSYILHQ
jgi:TonB family protein